MTTHKTARSRLTFGLIAATGASFLSACLPSCAGMNVVYDGYGSVTCAGDAVTMEPKGATVAENTHAALVVPERGKTMTEGKVKATMQTVKQVRQGEPNPWEVAWLLWSYTDPTHFYALVLKPNGWEVSKQDTAYPGAQRFLASGTSPTFEVGSTHSVEVSISHEGGAAIFTITVDGKHLATVTDSESPYLQGGPAFYTEDARVVFSELAVTEK
ncbi:MAG: hypothetical protein Q4C87_12940 [Actinomycetaceae bacterium]|nr:hypothetical protein [Actinomycetaceae bacterium]